MPSSPIAFEELCERFERGARQIFTHFEARPAQRQMLLDCYRALQEGGVALTEAGTGVGKTLAYLIPAAIWSAQTGQRVLIATHTITLQEQLLSKDIPLASAILDLPIQAALAKGMGNYLCQKRVDAATADSPQGAKQLEQWEHFLKFARSHRVHSRSDLPFSLQNAQWNKVQAESDSCLYQACEYYQRCGLMLARARATTAKIVVANHHLLFSDLAQRMKSGQSETSALPPYRALIVDEAHHAEEIAALNFSASLSQEESLQLLSKLFTGVDHARSWAVGKVNSLLILLSDLQAESTPLAQRLELLKRRAVEGLSQLFGALQELTRTAAQETSRGQEKKKWRLGTSHQAREQWRLVVHPHVNVWQTTLQELSLDIKEALERLEEFSGQEGLKSGRMRFFRAELGALINRMEQSRATLALFGDLTNRERVYWMEGSPDRIQRLWCSELNVGEQLQNGLFANIDSAIFCSATMTAKNSFAFFKNQMGLHRDSEIQVTSECTYPSPFDLTQRVLLAVPSDLPLPSQSEFLPMSASAIEAIVARIRGNCFILFTSQEAMLATVHRVQPRLEELGFTLLKQGDAPRSTLLERFGREKRAALFGMSSFWEGIDVAANTLRCVILAKLPFRVPSEPMHQARSEALALEGKDPFREEALPRAIIAFKQGFGRLIRRQEDYGCIVCLDRRLIASGYSRDFLGALPPCERSFEPMSVLPQRIGAYLRARESQVQANDLG